MKCHHRLSRLTALTENPKVTMSRKPICLPGKKRRQPAETMYMLPGKAVVLLHPGQLTLAAAMAAGITMTKPARPVLVLPGQAVVLLHPGRLMLTTAVAAGITVTKTAKPVLALPGQAVALLLPERLTLATAVVAGIAMTKKEPMAGTRRPQQPMRTVHRSIRMTFSRAPAHTHRTVVC